MANNQMPKVVLPRFEIMTKSPIEGLAEVRTSFSNTLASIEAALPAGGPGLPGQGQGGGQVKLGLPKLKQFALSIEEAGPTFMPKISQMAEQVEKMLGEGSETKRGTVTEEKLAPPGGVATRGSL